MSDISKSSNSIERSDSSNSINTSESNDSSNSIDSSDSIDSSNSRGVSCRRGTVTLICASFFYYLIMNMNMMPSSQFLRITKSTERIMLFSA